MSEVARKRAYVGWSCPKVAISNAQISLILPGLALLVGTNVRVSGDSARQALSNGVCNAIYD